MNPRIASIVMLPASVLLAACGSATGTVEDGEDACGASGYQALVGAPLAAVTLPADLGARIIREGDAVTMDFNAERMNIEVDAEGRVTRVFCG